MSLGSASGIGALVLLTSSAAAQQSGVRAEPQKFVSVEGAHKQWHPLTLSFRTAVDTDEVVHAPGANPFLDFRMEATFVHASGHTLVVAGFYAADGRAADTGASSGGVWQVRFAPDRPGHWEWSVTFRQGPSLAIDPLAPAVVADPEVDGAHGAFDVTPTDPSAPGFLAKGRLESVDEYYLRFAGTGEWFLKNGAGGPENFLAYWEFDGTTGNPFESCLLPDHLHHYAPHAGDYAGDAIDVRHTWGPEEKGKNLLGAINYLASVGVNSLYFITNNYMGDGEDVWPWTGPTDKLHFDVSKLDQWERLFSHMTQRGLMLQFVFEENENDQLPVPSGLGNGMTPERKLYYRELEARFGHHPAVIWITGDESDYWDEEVALEELATSIRAADPYRHPIAFHSKHPCSGSGCPETFPPLVVMYGPYFDHPDFDATACQTAPGAYNNSIIQLRDAQAASRRWAHFGDEQSLNMTAPNLVVNRTKALWGNLMAGGSGVAWYPGNDITSQYPPGADVCDYFDLSVEDFRLFDDYFVQTRAAIGLFQQHLPFVQMEPANELASPAGAEDFVFRRAADAGTGATALYAVYRGTGLPAALTITAGTFTVDWYNARTGEGPVASTIAVGPGLATLTPPTTGLGEDWLAIVHE
jgi:hypothetical protein